MIPILAVFTDVDSHAELLQTELLSCAPAGLRIHVMDDVAPSASEATRGSCSFQAKMIGMRCRAWRA